MKRKQLIGLCLLILVLTGCGAYRTRAVMPDPRPLTKPYSAEPVPGRAAKLQPVKGPLTLSRAIILALRKNPGLAAFSYEIREAEARALQAGLYPNPELDVQLENLGGSGQFGGLNQTETTIQVSQLILLSGQRGKAVRAAAFDSDLAAWDYENEKLNVFVDVRQAFIEVLGAQRSVALNEELVRLSRQLVKTVSNRVKAGKMSPAEVSRSKVLLAVTQIDLERARRQLESSRQQLAATWGDSIARFGAVIGKLDSLPAIPDREKLKALLNQNPVLARFETLLKQRAASVALEDARGIPNPVLSGGLRRLNESDDNAFVMGLSIPLPLSNRNQGSRQEARFALARTLKEKRAVEVRLISSLGRVYSELQNAFNEVKVIRNTILPEAQNAYNIIQDGYLKGRFNFLDVLDAQRTLFESRARYLKALISAQLAETEVERLVAQEIGSIQ